MVSPVSLTVQLALPSLLPGIRKAGFELGLGNRETLGWGIGRHLQKMFEDARVMSDDGGGGGCLCSTQRTMNPFEANSLAMWRYLMMRVSGR